MDKLVCASQGTIFQLVGRGPQDVFLSYNPQMTFFKRVYNRYTNFAIEQFDERFGTEFKFGSTNVCKIIKKGDLIGNMHLKIVLPNLGIIGTWKSLIGYSVFCRVRLRIGDTVVHDHERLWYDISDKLFCSSEHRLGVDKLIRRGETLSTNTTHELLIPLKFFCCKGSPWDKQQFIPITNLDTNVDVSIEIIIPPLQSLIIAQTEIPPSPTIDAAIVVDHIFLSDTEKHRVAQLSSLYVLDQIFDIDNVSYNTNESGISFTPAVYVNVRELNKPVKYFAIVAYKEGNTSFDYLDAFSTVDFYIGSEKQFETRPTKYFSLVQPYQHFTNIPLSNVCALSFCLDASSFQPSGSLNFANIRNGKFAFSVFPEINVPIKIKMFAVCVNFLKFESGLCSLLFV